MNKLVLLTILFPFFTSPLFAQNEVKQSLIPRPPGVENFAKYTDIPVSHYTGVPSISVPVYNLKHRDIEVPIALDYHSSGIRNRDEASWVGLGWILQPGGMITREIRDKDDLSDKSEFFRSNLPIPEFQESGFITLENGVCSMPYEDPNMPGLMRQDVLGDPQPRIDEYDWAPDVYTFDINGFTGKFILNQDRNVRPKIVSESVVAKIDYSGSLSDDGFIITDGNGMRYYFQEKAKTSFGLDAGAPSYVYGWHLNKIKSPKGDSVQFLYATDTVQLTEIRGKSAKFRKKVDFSFAQSLYILSEHEAMAVCYDDYRRSNDIGPQVQTSFYYAFDPVLRSIISPSATIKFNVENRNSRWDLISIDLLDNTVSTPNVTIKKRFDFAYDHFYDSDKKEIGKLKLLSVQEQGRNPYRFQYFNNFSTKYGQGDHWGFYNGTESYSIPLVQYNQNNEITTHYLGISRETKQDLVKAGVLKSITYPTGGQSIYEFESNTFGNGVADNSNPIMTRQYHADVNSSGIVYQGIGSLSLTDNSFFIEGSVQHSYTTIDLVIDEIKLNFTDNLEWQNYTYLQKAYVVINGYKFGITGNNEHPIKYRLNADSDYTFTMPVEVNKNLNVKFFLPEGSTAEIDLKVHYDKRRYGGGLRIKTIEYNDGNSDTENKVTRFFYGEQIVVNGVNTEGSSYGKLLDIPRYYQHYTSYNQFNADLVFDCSRLLIGNDSFNPKVNAIVGYDKVIVKSEGNGREERYFHNERYSISNSSLAQDLPVSIDLQNGFLDSTRIFSEDSILRQKSINSYSKETVDSNRGAIYIIDDVNAAILRGSVANGQPPNGCAVAVAGFIVYQISTQMNRLSSTQEYLYDSQGGNPVISTKEYRYDNLVHQNLTQSTTTDSKGNKHITTTTYPADYPDSIGFIGELKNSFIHNVPIEIITHVEKLDESKEVISGRTIAYKTDGRGLVDKEYYLKSSPIAATAFKFSNQSTAGELPFNSESEAYQKDSRFEERMSYDYDTAFNIKAINKTHDASTLLIWGYRSALPVAIVENASADKIAYSNFETETDKGNWDYNLIDRVYEQTTHRWSLNGSLSKTGLSGASKVGLWSKGINTPLVNNVSGEKRSTVNGWDYYEWMIDGNAVVNSNGNYIDDVRLHPVSAQMTTYSYDPLYGITSTMDTNGNMSYYEYDDSGRLEIIRDKDFNILKHVTYKYSNN